MELTILMPCLNEEKTIAYCIEEASSFLLRSGISGEILIADNGSSDKSVQLAREMGARVVSVKKKGYGVALRKGIREARGKYVIYGDCDMSYNFFDCNQIYNSLLQGNALVVGNRFNDCMERGSMPFLHQYIGVPLLSFIGRKKYNVNIKDFHCGLRGIDKSKLKNISFRTTGMEFATEIIAVFAKRGLPVGQVNIRFRKDKRGGKSHLRTFRDGLRHLVYMFYS